MKLKNIIKILVLSIILMALNFVPAFADVGSFDSYDSGGDWGSSSDWGSWDDDYSYSGESGDFGFLLGWMLGSKPGAITTLIIIAIIVIIVKQGKKSGWNQNSYGPTNQKYADRNIPTTVYTTNIHDVPQTHIHAEEIKKIDPLFSEEKFLSWAKDLYVKLQHAWTERQWEEMRPFETPELFEQHSSQLQEYIKNGTINVVDRIAVNYATIYGFRQTEEKDIVEVALKATKKDYIINEKTQAVVEGNKDQYRITVYKMTFERTKGKLTQQETDTLDAKNCPNCGAPLKITSAGKCEYCGSIVTAGVHDWVLSNIEPLRY